MLPLKYPSNCGNVIAIGGKLILTRNSISEQRILSSESKGVRVFLCLVQNKHSTRSGYEASETMLIFVIMGGQWMDGLFDEPSARAVNSPPPSCYKDSIEQVAPAMPRARHEPN